MAKCEPQNHQSFMDDKSNIQIYKKFDDMPLHQDLLRGIYSYGFETPSAIQQRAIVPLIGGGDIIAQAQSGTGKTGAFSIGLLQRLDFRFTTKTQALVLSPTRELAQQTYGVISQIGEYLSKEVAFCYTFIGGAPIQDDIKKITKGVMVAIGTPGRICDLISRTILRTNNLKVCVLDEADEMLSQGFSDQIYDIFRYFPKDIQLSLFSATMPENVLELSSKFMRDPTRILVSKDKLTLEGIKQYYIAVEEENKFDTLLDLYDSVSVAQSVIFVNTKRKVILIYENLTKQGHTVSIMHSDMSRAEREKVMSIFRSASSRILVTTDLIARGIDVHHVNIVINYDLPLNLENYLHRIGRSGRYGRKGIAINFVTSKDTDVMHNIESYYHTQIEELPTAFETYLE